jgi:predicted nucleic acid-binding protein
VFSHILIPPGVATEVRPERALADPAALPWITVSDSLDEGTVVRVMSEHSLGRGESEAILLAEQEAS